MARTELVLLVGEDDAFPMYAEYLTHLKIEAIVRASPNQAIAALTEQRPLVIVTELAFGNNLDAGCDFLKAIRNQTSTAGAIIIVVSGFARAADATLAWRCGADQFFGKPLTPADLGTAVSTSTRPSARRYAPRVEWPAIHRR